MAASGALDRRLPSDCSTSMAVPACSCDIHSTCDAVQDPDPAGTFAGSMDQACSFAAAAEEPVAAAAAVDGDDDESDERSSVEGAWAHQPPMEEEAEVQASVSDAECYADCHSNLHNDISVGNCRYWEQEPSSSSSNSGPDDGDYANGGFDVSSAAYNGTCIESSSISSAVEAAFHGYRTCSMTKRRRMMVVERLTRSC